MRAGAAPEEGGVEGASSQAERHNLVGIQILRGWAAATVAFQHLLGQVSHTVDMSHHLGYFPAAMGVDIFFTISGFIMIYTTYNRFGLPGEAWGFFLRRLIRILPLYWIFTIVMALALNIRPDVFNTATFDWNNFFASLFFYPYPRETGLVKPILSLGWTLNYEMMFYVIFAGGVLFPRKIGIPLIVVGLATLVFLGQVTSFDHPALRFWTQSVIAEFAFGIGIGLLYLRWGARRISPVLWCLLFGAVIALSMVTTWLDAVNGGAIVRAVGWGIPATMLLILASLVVPAGVPGFLVRVGQGIGDSSYALYLSHRFIFGAGVLAWATLIGMDTLPLWLTVAFLLAMSLIGGYLVFMVVERPILALLNARLLGKPRRPISARRAAV